MLIVSGWEIRYEEGALVFGRTVHLNCLNERPDARHAGTFPTSKVHCSGKVKRRLSSVGYGQLAFRRQIRYRMFCDRGVAVEEMAVVKSMISELRAPIGRAYHWRTALGTCSKEAARKAFSNFAG